MPTQNRKMSQRAHRRRGAEMLEFTLTLLPMLAMIFVLLDVSWGVFVKSTLQYAVRAGVRRGITITGTQATAGGACLTEIVKGVVQTNSLGLLRGTTGLAAIKVNYLKPPPPGSTAAATDVSTQANGNQPLNIMQVSVQNFALAALAPRVFSWREAPDKASTIINAASADLIEPSRDVPCIGVAP